jgi:uncharacterized membrane protein YbhN (UPF0104 family)
MRPTSAKTPKQRLFALLKVAVSIVLLYLLLQSMDAAVVAGILGRLPIMAIAVACALLVLQALVLAVRWWLVMAAIGVPLKYGKIMPLTYMGVFFNQVLPTSFGGDAVRMWQAYRAGVPTEAAVGSVLLERISGVIGLVVLTTLGVWYMGGNIDNEPLRLVLLAMLPLTFLGVAVLASLDRMPNEWRQLPVLAELTRLAVDSRRIFFAPGTAVPLLLLSILSHALAAGAVYAFAEGLRLDLSIWDCLALFPAVILATMLPISFAGWGIREGAMVMLFAFAGVNADTALALSLAFGLAFLAASLPGCAFWLTWRNAMATGTTP